MKEATFSIIIPTRNRAGTGKLRRSLTSVQGQVYPNWEAIIVDDCSRPPAKEIVESFHEPRFRLIRLEPAVSRVVVRNKGMAEAKNDWICWLDDDDAYDLEYLHTFAYHIEQEPEVRLWECGVIVHAMFKKVVPKKDKELSHICPKYTKFRKAWMPPLNKDSDFPVHTHFNSGHVGTGMFVFHRECLEKIGFMPPWKNPYQIADGVDEWLGYTTGYSAAKQIVGNPWGEDWCAFRKLSMFYEVHTLEANLYIQYRR